MATVIDPVCGMRIEADDAAAIAEHQRPEAWATVHWNRLRGSHGDSAGLSVVQQVLLVDCSPNPGTWSRCVGDDARSVANEEAVVGEHDPSCEHRGMEQQ